MAGETITITDEKQRVFTTKVDAEGRFSFPRLSPMVSVAGNGGLDLVPEGCAE
jgi:hypothetical protein